MSGLKEKNSTEDSSNKEDNNIPILLLSKDLINHINSINENSLEITNIEKESKDINNYFNSSESSNDEEQLLKDLNSNNSLFKKNLLKNDEKEINNQKRNDIVIQKEEEKNNIFPPMIFQPPIINNFQGNQPQLINKSMSNFNKQIIQKENLINPIGSNSFNKNSSDFNLFQNNIQNQMNFMNSCFTMNGKKGWICSKCKSFNYKSKYFLFI